MTEPNPAGDPAPQAQETGQPEAPKPTETVDFWKQKAREQEKRAKANADAADELARIREASKSEAEKTAERLAVAEKDAASARSEALRLRIAAKHGIGDEQADLFLNGSDEETLTRQAQALVALASDRKKQGNHVPREGTPTAPGESDKREFARQLFDAG